VRRLVRSDPYYPVSLVERLGAAAPRFIDAIGNLDLLSRHKVALFCSRCCPAEKIIEAQDLARRLRDEGVTVISGFHSPVEKECLRVLLKGTQPIIICPARGLEGMRLPSEWREALAAKRLLILSLFGKTLRRSTAEAAFRRNEFVGALADQVQIIHAESKGKLAMLATETSRASDRRLL